MIAPTRSSIRRRPVDPAPLSEELPRRPIEPKPTISEGTPTDSSTPPTFEAQGAEDAQRQLATLPPVALGETSFDVTELARRNYRESQSIHGARLHGVL
jgi:hypothetical protein